MNANPFHHPWLASAHNPQRPCCDARPRHFTMRSAPPGARASTLASSMRSAIGEGRVHSVRALAQDTIHHRRVRRARPLAKPRELHAGAPAQPKRTKAADRVVRAAASNPRLAPRRGRKQLADKRLERPRGAR